MAVIAVIISENPVDCLWQYVLEIMAVEGLPRADTIEAGRLAEARQDLDDHAAVIVPSLELSEAATAALLAYLRAGGSLLLLKPCTRLARGLGLEAADVPEHLLRDAYLELERTHPLTTIVPEGIPYLQYHGPADAYLPGIATAAAYIYWGGASMPYPAILTGQFGKGRFVIFAYDLALSTMLFHQGLRSQSSTGARPDRSGDNTYTPNDLFVGYLNAELRLIPQADLQQRMLSAALDWLLQETTPLPRVWYYPESKPAVALINGDGDAMTIEEMCLYVDAVERFGGCYGVYVLCDQYDYVPAALIEHYRRRGHYFGPHIWQELRPSPQSFHEHIQHEVRAFAERYGFQPLSTRHHCVVWPGWTEPAQALAQAGIRMELNFRAAQHYREGYLTGSGLPIRYVDDHGEMVDVQQQPTLLSDDFLFQNKSFLTPLKTGEVIALTKSMIDDCVERYHTVFHPYFHPVYSRLQPPLVPGTYTLPWLEATLAHCNLRGLPILSLDRWCVFSLARRQALPCDVTYDSGQNTLSFRIATADASTASSLAGLTMIVPARWNKLSVNRISQANEPIPFTQEKWFGHENAVFAVEANYNAPILVTYI
ncbi:MAG: hypothetical protein ACUVWR_17105 [Anaerolineae bacterium]